MRDFDDQCSVWIAPRAVGRKLENKARAAFSEYILLVCSHLRFYCYYCWQLSKKKTEEEEEEESSSEVLFFFFFLRGRRGVFIILTSILRCVFLQLGRRCFFVANGSEKL